MSHQLLGIVLLAVCCILVADTAGTSGSNPGDEDAQVPSIPKYEISQSLEDQIESNFDELLALDKQYANTTETVNSNHGLAHFLIRLDSMLTFLAKLQKDYIKYQKDPKVLYYIIKVNEMKKKIPR